LSLNPTCKSSIKLETVRSIRFHLHLRLGAGAHTKGMFVKSGSLSNGDGENLQNALLNRQITAR
jgi:hypothetical protein